MKGTAINAKSKVGSPRQVARKSTVRATKQPGKTIIQVRDSKVSPRAKSSGKPLHKPSISASDLDAVRQSRHSLTARSVARPGKDVQATAVVKHDYTQAIRIVALIAACGVIAIVNTKVSIGFAMGLFVCMAGHD